MLRMLIPPYYVRISHYHPPPSLPLDTSRGRLESSRRESSAGGVRHNTASNFEAARGRIGRWDFKVLHPTWWLERAVPALSGDKSCNYCSSLNPHLWGFIWLWLDWETLRESNMACWGIPRNSVGFKLGTSCRRGTIYLPRLSTGG